MVESGTVVAVVPGGGNEGISDADHRLVLFGEHEFMYKSLDSSGVAGINSYLRLVAAGFAV